MSDFEYFSSSIIFFMQTHVKKNTNTPANSMRHCYILAIVYLRGSQWESLQYWFFKNLRWKIALQEPDGQPGRHTLQESTPICWALSETWAGSHWAWLFPELSEISRYDVPQFPSIRRVWTRTWTCTSLAHHSGDFSHLPWPRLRREVASRERPWLAAKCRRVAWSFT